MPGEYFSTLISTQDLARQLESEHCRVFDCRFTLTDTNAGRLAFQLDHVKHAQYVHLEDDLSSPISPRTGRHPLPDAYALSDKLGLWGVDASTQVVVYDDNFGAVAARMWWLLKWLGHKNVALLDGGYAKWKREGFPIDSNITQHKGKTFIPNIRTKLAVDSETVMLSLVQKTLPKNNYLIVDARAKDRFEGEREPLDKVAGHIPGAINHPFEDNLDFSRSFLTAKELRDIYQEITAQTAAEKIIHMCGSGVTACHNLLAMEHAGLMGSKLYVGSWSEWITDPNRPIAK